MTFHTILFHSYQFTTLYFLIVHIECHKVHAFRQIGRMPSVGVFAKSVCGSICINYHTRYVGKDEAYLVRARLPYDVWDIYMRGEWVRVGYLHLHALNG